MNKIVFASMASQQAMGRVTLLFESLRAFGGELAQSPCILFIPGTMNTSRTEIDNRLRHLNVNVIALPLDREIG